MGWFSRKKSVSTTADSSPDAQTEVDAGKAASSELSGPLDYTQVSDTSKLVDFGAILIPPTAGLQIMPEFSQDNSNVVALTLQMGSAAVQVMVSSAPKSSGLWEEVRGELLADLTKQGATCESREGDLGSEVFAQIPAAGPGGKRGYVQMRFAGVDGPNWFMRLVFNNTGPEQMADYEKLNEVVRGLVVKRDDSPRPPREVLPLSLPEVPQADNPQEA